MQKPVDPDPVLAIPGQMEHEIDETNHMIPQPDQVIAQPDLHLQPVQILHDDADVLQAPPNHHHLGK